jgi:general secretion pathway protein A
MTPSYEASFGLHERPFSLTPDPRYFFKSRSHGRATESLTFGLRRQEQFLLVTGDLGIGKTTVARVLLDQLRRKGPVSFVRSPLLTPGGLFRLLLEDFGALGPDDQARVNDATPHELHDLVSEFLHRREADADGAIVLVDEAHTLPPVLVEQVLSLAGFNRGGRKLLRFVLIGQSTSADSGVIGVRTLDDRVTTNARLLPLGREECAQYVGHRMATAGASPGVFAPRALDVLHDVSGGMPRLVNLLCERALQEAASQGKAKVEPDMVDASASALQLLRSRPRRFRWFTRRVS